MSSAFRRFEILLPLRFNDGQPAPGELIADTLIELGHRFGAVTSETETIHGLWQHQGQSYRDDLTRVFVDVADTAQSVAFFRDFKERLKSRFRQIDIWMTTYPVDVLWRKLRRVVVLHPRSRRPCATVLIQPALSRRAQR